MCKDVGRRVELLREKMGLKSQQALADWLEVKRPTVGAWERGTTMIPVRYAALMCSETGNTLDYLYLGKDRAIYPKTSIPMDDLERITKDLETIYTLNNKRFYELSGTIAAHRAQLRRDHATQRKDSIARGNDSVARLPGASD